MKWFPSATDVGRRSQRVSVERRKVFPLKPTVVMLKLESVSCTLFPFVLLRKQVVIVSCVLHDRALGRRGKGEEWGGRAANDWPKR